MSTKQLSVGGTIRRAFAALAGKSAALGRVTLVALAIFVVVGLVVDHFLPILTLFLVPATVFLTFGLHAAACHRIFLDEGSMPNRWGVYWTRRDTRFLVCFLVIGVLYFLVAMAFYLVLPVDPGPEPPAEWAKWTIKIAYQAVLVYLTTRVALIFPMTAVGHLPALRWAWGLSKGQSIRFVIAVGLPIALVFAASGFLSSSLREAGWSPGTSLMVGSLGSLAFNVVTAALLSVAYRTLSEGETPPDLPYGRVAD